MNNIRAQAENIVAETDRLGVLGRGTIGYSVAVSCVESALAAALAQEHERKTKMPEFLFTAILTYINEGKENLLAHMHVIERIYLGTWPLGINKEMDDHAAKRGLHHWSCTTKGSNFSWQRFDGAVCTVFRLNTAGASYIDELREFDKCNPVQIFG